MGGRNFIAVVFALFWLVLNGASAQGQTELIGLFTIEYGSTYNMPGVGGVGTLMGGTDGGLLTGQFQPDPEPTTAQGDTTGSEAVIDPATFMFFGFPCYVSTNEINPWDGTVHPLPSITDNGGILTGDLSSWDWTWNGTHANQGAPKDNSSRGQPNNPAPSGTYDSATGAYALSWESLFVGGPFNGFMGQWQLAGHLVIPCDLADPTLDCDRDGVLNSLDNCVEIRNPTQNDCDGNGVGDACDLVSLCADRDGDGLVNSEDNCPMTPNPTQNDCDLDGIGDACDPDLDGDGFEGPLGNRSDCNDTCSGGGIYPGAVEIECNEIDEDCDGTDAVSSSCTDTDGDLVVDIADNCPHEANPRQTDCDGDGFGDACDLYSPCSTDSDGDGVMDHVDNCIHVPNPNQADSDGDGFGNACDGIPQDFPRKIQGLFTIEAGSSFFMAGVGGVDTLMGGTDGGFLSGQFQPDPPPTTATGDTTGSDRIIDSTSFVFFGFPSYTSTNSVDPVYGWTYSVPMVWDNGNGTITADLSAWDLTWNGTHFNQGAPRSYSGSYPDDPAPTGTYDPGTGAYTLAWKSLIQGGPGMYSGEWFLVGHGPRRAADTDSDGILDDGDGSGFVGDAPCSYSIVNCDDNCMNTPNPDQADLDQDGVGDACDCDADGDGFLGDTLDCGGVDCDDLNAQAHPGSIEICNNGLDENCDGADIGDCPAILAVFPIEAGSTFNMPYVGGAHLLSGTDGGFVSGQYQHDPTPTSAVGDESGSNRIIDPETASFFGWPIYVSTNEIDPVDGITTYPPPTIYDNRDGTISANLQAWDVMWNGTHFNQGAPKYQPSGGPLVNPGPTGTFDAGTGAFTLMWSSLIFGGPFDGFTGEWTLMAGPISGCIDQDQDGICASQDNCALKPNPDQADLDGDGLGDVCDSDVDGDGYDKRADCDDMNPAISPGAAEVCGNSIDENCDGVAPICVLEDVSVTSFRVPNKIRTCSSRSKKITAKIENVGERPESVDVYLYKDFAVQQKKTLLLEPGGTARVVFYVDPSILVRHTLWCVEADIGLGDETPDNNKACALTIVTACE